MSIDLMYDIGRKGADSTLAKVMGRTYHGRERNISFKQEDW